MPKNKIKLKSAKMCMKMLKMERVVIKILVHDVLKKLQKRFGSAHSKNGGNFSSKTFSSVEDFQKNIYKLIFWCERAEYV